MAIENSTEKFSGCVAATIASGFTGPDGSCGVVIESSLERGRSGQPASLASLVRSSKRHMFGLLQGDILFGLRAEFRDGACSMTVSYPSSRGDMLPAAVIKSDGTKSAPEGSAVVLNRHMPRAVESFVQNVNPLLLKIG